MLGEDSYESFLKLMEKVVVIKVLLVLYVLRVHLLVFEKRNKHGLHHSVQNFEYKYSFQNERGNC